jgi:phage terminase Nu1 subunit (DNA packaging protein)
MPRAKGKGRVKPKAATAAPPAERSRLVNRTELARALGVNAFTVTKWQNDGLPVAERGGPGRESRYDLALAMAWWRARETTRLGGAGGAASLEVERARLARAQTEKAQLDLELKRGQLLPVGEITRVWGNITAAIRAKLLALPQAAAERCVEEAAHGAAAVQQVLEETIHEALRELGSWTPPPARAAAQQGGAA